MNSWWRFGGKSNRLLCNSGRRVSVVSPMVYLFMGFGVVPVAEVAVVVWGVAPGWFVVFPMYW